ncbi:MAG: hypothetical protein ABIS45_17465 [Burkholderiales bacterium]
MVDTGEWKRLANALRELHRTLLENARREYEREHAVALQPGELLQLLAAPADFAWLRSLSELMVDIDIVHDADLQQRDEFAAAVRGAIEQLISNTHDPVSVFAQRYWPSVHGDPHVAMAHAAVKQLLGGWPRPVKNDTASLLHERHRLAEKARHLVRKN